MIIKAFAYATRFTLIFTIFAGIGGYHQVTWRDILAQFFLFLCFDIMYSKDKMRQQQQGREE